MGEGLLLLLWQATEVMARASGHAPEVFTLLVQPRPAAEAGQLRYRFAHEQLRSHAYPLYPSEDRPSLGALDA